MAKFFIAIPTYDKRIDIEIANTIRQLPNEYPGDEFGLDFIATSLITDARNYLVRRFLDSGADWLYFWDSDIVIRDLSFLEKLIETSVNLDAPIVGGAYRFKHPKGLYVAGRVKDNTIENLTIKDLTQPILVDALGTGSMLIHRKVFETLPDPWFSFVDLPGKTIPEDFNFCRNAGKAGFKIALDPRFATYHYGTAFWEHLPSMENQSDSS